MRSSESLGVYVVELAGRLDLRAAMRLEDELDAIPREDGLRVVIDLRALDFIDSSGLRLILAMHSACRRRGQRLTLRRGPSHVHSVFELTRLTRILRFDD
jgi:anti-sigma B factor antagonist